MNKKKKEIILAITVGTLLLGFIPAVQAKSTILPLERWWEDSWWWYAGNPHLGGFLDPESWLVVRPHTTDGEVIFPPPPDDPYWQWYYKPIWECDYSGYVKVRELNDNDGYDLQITVMRKCNDAPFIIFDGMVGFFPIFKGLMKYYSYYEFKIDLELYPFQDEDGWYLPIWWMPLFGWNTLDPRDDGMVAVRSHFVAMGEGEFVEPWNGWVPGDKASVKVNQIGLVKFLYGEDDWGEHPNYYSPAEDYIYGELWPVEFIRVS